VIVRFSIAFKKQLRRLARKYRHIRSDIEPLIDDLRAGKTPGDQIRGARHTVYKVRVRNSDTQRGTSGGYRVIYYIAQADDILFVAVYSKSDQDDIATDAIKDIIDGDTQS
jgi:mRNA-degrading endonuclease RelE of RelBE toxin-antitoxin system